MLMTHRLVRFMSWHGHHMTGLITGVETVTMMKRPRKVISIYSNVGTPR